MLTFLNNDRNACILSIIIISLSLLYFIQFINEDFIGSDYGNYLQGATSIINYGTYSTIDNPQIPDNFRPIGTSLIIAFSKLINPYYFNEIVISIQCILFIWMFVLTLKTLKLFDLYNPLIIYITLAFFLHPMMLETATQIQSDLFTAFFIFAFSYNFSKYLFKSNNKNLYLSILMLSLSLYFRPTFLYFIPIVIWTIYKYGNGKQILITIAILLLVQSPWIIRNKVVLNTYKIATLGDIVLVYYAGETLRQAYGLEPDPAFALAAKKVGFTEWPHLKNKNDFDMIENAKHNSIKLIAEHHTSFLLAWLRGTARVFLMPHEIYSIRNNTTINVEKFITLLKSNPSALKHHINAYFIYLYIVPYLINIMILFGLFKVFLNAKKYYFSNQKALVFLILLSSYGLLIPGPINRPHYMIYFYLGLIIIFIYGIKEIINPKVKQ